MINYKETLKVRDLVTREIFNARIQSICNKHKGIQYNLILSNRITGKTHGYCTIHSYKIVLPNFIFIHTDNLLDVLNSWRKVRAETYSKPVTKPEVQSIPDLEELARKFRSECNCTSEVRSMFGICSRCGRIVS